MKMRIAFLIGFLVGAWGCGTGDTVVGPPPPVTAVPVTPVPPPPTVTRNPHVTPTPTPQCRNFKLCQGQ
jgi:hypothetical protein